DEIGPIYSMDTFIVNLVGTRSKSYLKAKLELELSNEKVKDEINKRLPQFRDTILTLLSTKSDGDIRTLEGKFQVRTEIMMQLNQYLTSGNIRNVYFTDFIVQ
ncbi:MAG: flagellar basal body-associated FliL family protein, partial [Deltaproteobacteria bacterium]|nr:flagellar basal body-associated FliL family protein [Deltaproteobacteria bacterium]